LSDFSLCGVDYDGRSVAERKELIPKNHSPRAVIWRKIKRKIHQALKRGSNNIISTFSWLNFDIDNQQVLEQA